MSRVTFDVYVANLPEDYSENEIKEIFNLAGDISGVKILPSKGYGGKTAFVKFFAEEDAKTAAQYIHNNEVKGSKLIVRYNKQPPKYSPFSGSDTMNGINKTSVKSPSANEKSTVPLDQMITVLVVHIESPIQFWAQICTRESATKVAELTDQLESVCPKQPIVVGQLSTQQIYGCKFSLDGMWYRCRIEKCLIDNMVKVRYIDYGNSEVLRRSGLVMLPGNLSIIPAFADRYVINGLELVDQDLESDLNKKGMETLSSLLNEQSIDLKVKRVEHQIHYAHVYQITDGELLDLPSKMLPTSSVKTASSTMSTNKENAFPPPDKMISRTRSPFSSVINGIKKQTVETDVSANHVKEQANTQLYKEKLEEYAKDLERKQTEVEVLTEKLQKKSSECVEIMSNAVHSRINMLLETVSQLRKARKNVPTGDDIFPSGLQQTFDLCLSSEHAIDLSKIKQYEVCLSTEELLHEQLEMISVCQDKTELTELISIRDKLAKKYVRDIKSFQKNIALLPLEQRMDNISKALNDLKDEYNQIITNAISEDIDRTLLLNHVKKYEDLKHEKSSDVKALQQSSNEKSNIFFRAMSEIQRECHCVVSDASGEVLVNIDNVINEYERAMKDEIDGITVSQSDDTQAFDAEVNSFSSLKDIIIALASVLQKESNDINKIRSQVLPSLKEKREHYEKLLQNKPDTTSIMTIRKTIKTLKSKFRHKMADITDLEEESDESSVEELQTLNNELQQICNDLHPCFIEELVELKKLSEMINDFPELKIQYPELGLEKFKESNYLLQKSRTLEHYGHGEMITLPSFQKQTTYKTMFNQAPCIVKEISLNGKDLNLSTVVSRVADYMKTVSMNHVQIEAIFSTKNERKCYIHQAFMIGGNIKEFLEKNEVADSLIELLLKDVLIALNHKQDAYSALKPENILVHKREEDDRPKAYLAEPNFVESQEKQLTNCLHVHRVISGYPVLDMYQEAVSKQADMICFGGLLLWALHRSSKFSKNVHCDLEMIVQNPDLKDVLRKILTPTSSERLACDQTLHHAYFTNIKEHKPSVVDEESNDDKESAKTNNKEGNVDKEQTNVDNKKASVDEEECNVDVTDSNSPVVEDQKTNPIIVIEDYAETLKDKQSAEKNEDSSNDEDVKDDNQAVENDVEGQTNEETEDEKPGDVSLITTEDEEEETQRAEEDAAETQDAWNKALLAKRQRASIRIAAALETEPENTPLDDNDDDDF